MIYALIFLALFVFWKALSGSRLSRPKLLRAVEDSNPQSSDFSQYAAASDAYAPDDDDDAIDPDAGDFDAAPPCVAAAPETAAVPPVNTTHAAQMAAITRTIYGPGVCSPR